MLKKLTELPNIGEVLSAQLIQVGILTPNDLIETGSKEAFILIRNNVDSTACLTELYALEGAVQNIRWHGLSEEVRQELKTFFISLTTK